MDFIRQFPRSIRGWVALYALVLMVYSSAKHLLFQSTAMDLSYFDQAAYLISQGQVPIVSFWGYHFLGGHADWIVYGLGLLYRIYPSVYWLLGVQAIALASGGLVAWKLSEQAGLTKPWSNTLTAAYLLQPLIFNINLFDFHPEVIAVPLILAAVWAARAGRLVMFSLAIVLALGCRDSLSLNIAGLGVWLLITKRRIPGAIALFLGCLWFYLATQWVIPSFRPGGVESIARYAEFGNSIGGILASMVLKPGLWILRIAKRDNLVYLLLLFLPWVWGLKFGKALLPLLPAVPTIATNLITTYYPQKDIVHQYSLPVIPFLWLAALQTIVLTQQNAKQPWFRRRRLVLLWSALMFLCLSKFSYLGSRYLENLDTWQVSRSAIAQIPPQASVLASAKLAPHLAHRPHLKITMLEQTVSEQLDQMDYVLIDRRHPGAPEKVQTLDRIIQAAKSDRHRQLLSHQDDIYLFGPASPNGDP
jgi:uncharacterized membrane protein